MPLHIYIYNGDPHIFIVAAFVVRVDIRNRDSIRMPKDAYADSLSGECRRSFLPFLYFFRRGCAQSCHSGF